MRPAKVMIVALSVICFLLGLQIVVLELEDVTDVTIEKGQPKPVPELLEFSLSDHVLGDKQTAEILQRPIFSDNRKPSDADILAEAESKESAEELVNADLEVEVRGIIIGPNYRIVTLRDTKTKKTIILREGEHLEEDKSAWTLDSVSERKVAFSNSRSGESAELELKVYKGSLGGKSKSAGSAGKKTGRKQRGSGKETNKSKATAAKSDSTGQADDIRRKVAERRARMRAEAAKKRAQKNNGNQD